VIQIAAAKGHKTINFTLDRCVIFTTFTGSFNQRDDVELLKQHLELLGATYVVTYDELSDKSLRTKVKTWTGGKVSTSSSSHSIN